MKPVVAVVNFFIFLLLAIMVHMSISDPIDKMILLWVEEKRTSFGNAIFKTMSTIGSIKVLLPLAVVSGLVALLYKKFLDALFIMLVFWGSRELNHLLKLVFHRERPFFHRLFGESGYSFPSGHAMNSTIFLGFLYYATTRSFRLSQFQKRCVQVVLYGMIGLIACSRVYAGVHYPTDIVAGICGGVVILSGIIYIHQRVLHQ
ncbi:phosphatase PAP2 family protein [Sporosarcina sp. Te-1]|uniref:phosphatase PAP2 family protein n=1 Tax=Sporosarcina sp. Te-1 TaxID=2818390 RepID=UPI001A9CD68F|nr:phosphatase PAP2 family protein [Sporosarcina sp. Te-1]QTD42091.1 phosphatase PAP2 family protein [Sporosarcina sp. Te-1]